MRPVIEEVRNFIERHGLLAKGDRVLLSLSAGKDSMFLLHSLLLLRDELCIQPGIFHLNHMSRGSESDRDEDFLRELGARLGLDLHMRRYDVNAGREAGESFEEHGRNVRYRMLGEIADAEGYSAIATAHSRDDQVETVLMRLFTGTGIHGLQGILPRRGKIVRPLLSVGTYDIYAYLRDHGLAWREDATNAERTFARNFIRHEVAPRVRDKFPMADDSIISLSRIAGEYISMVDEMLYEKYGDLAEWNNGLLCIDADAVKHSFPVFSHVVASLIRKNFNHHVNRRMLEEIYSKYIVEKANISIYKDKTLRIEKKFRKDRSWLALGTTAEEAPVPPQWEYRIDLDDENEHILELSEIGIAITIAPSDYVFFRKFSKNSGYIFVTLENSPESIYIRNRRAGDVIKTEKGAKKIKDILIEKKLDHVSKERVPLLVAGDTVIACMTGLIMDIPSRVAADFLVDKNSKKVVAVYKNQ